MMFGVSEEYVDSKFRKMEWEMEKWKRETCSHPLGNRVMYTAPVIGGYYQSMVHREKCEKCDEHWDYTEARYHRRLKELYKEKAEYYNNLAEGME
jgi:hypothetical protein